MNNHNLFENTSSPMIVISIVSHNQGKLINKLFDDLVRLRFAVHVILTINIPEDLEYTLNRNFSLDIILNDSPKGFGENHNFAFNCSPSDFFLVLNPDIRLINLDLSTLLFHFRDERVGVVSPCIVSPEGIIEDSARKFLTPFKLIKRIFTKNHSFEYDFSIPFTPDWTAGMFMLFRSKAYKNVNGFDQNNFFMYCEDMDICHSLWMNNWSVWYDPSVSVIHDARRSSRKNVYYLYLHITSLINFFGKRMLCRNGTRPL